VFKEGTIREKFIYEIWKSKDFIKTLRTPDGQDIEIIDSGENNKDFAGPDFFNSRIRIGSLTFNGDVEIDIRHSDWKSHGHNLDKKYNKVILHLVLSKEKFYPQVYTQDGRKINSVCISDFIAEDLQSSVRKAINSERNNRTFVMPCAESNKNVDLSKKINFLAELGVQRFKQKERKIFFHLKEMVYLKEMKIREPVVHYDFGEDFHNKKFSSEDFNDPILWKQIIYEMIFEALGYSKNKKIMLDLAKAVNIEFLLKFKDDENFLEKIESILFNVSGILVKDHSTLTEDTVEYLRNATELWTTLKNEYDGIMFKNEDWNYFKLRPHNFPTVRLAGGSRFLLNLLTNDIVGKIIEQFTSDIKPIKLTAGLRNLFIIKADGFWQNHYVFDKNTKEAIKYFIGLARADEMIINVVLPTFAVYFEIFENNDASRRVKSMYLNYQQKSRNNIVERVATSLNLKGSDIKSVHIQGMLELFRGYCIREKCLKCEIGKVAFN